MKTIQQQSTETREAYLRKALRYCKKQFAAHCELDPYCHQSHNVAAAMRDTEERYSDLGTFGVEGSTQPDIQYLNSGDSYESTIVFWRGRFRVCCWGDIAERYDEGLI